VGHNDDKCKNASASSPVLEKHITKHDGRTVRYFEPPKKLPMHIVCWFLFLTSTN